jgi:hypothetical protein
MLQSLVRVWKQSRIILLGQRNHGGDDGLGRRDWDEVTKNIYSYSPEKPLENINLADQERDSNKSL